MDDKFVSGIIGILTAVIGVSIIAVLVSSQAKTGDVITAGGNAFTSILKAAVSPVTSSGGSSLNTGLVGGNGGLSL